MEVEQQFVAALGNATTYTLAGDTLTLRDASGSTQVTFTTANVISRGRPPVAGGFSAVRMA